MSKNSNTSINYWTEDPDLARLTHVKGSVVLRYYPKSLVVFVGKVETPPRTFQVFIAYFKVKRDKWGHQAAG